MSTRAWFRLALFCAVFPLVAGPAAFLVWAWKRSDGAALGAYLTIKLGVYLFLLGLFALPKFLLRSKADGAGLLPRRGIVVGVLLVLNLPLAGGLAWGIYSISTRFSVTIVNRSGETLHEVAVLADDLRIDVGTLLSDGRVTRRFGLRGDATLRFEGRMGGRTLSATIESYVTPNLGDAWTVTVDRDGAPGVEKGYR